MELSFFKISLEFFLKLFRWKKRIDWNHKEATLFERHEYNTGYIVYFEIHLQVLNTSSYSFIVSDFNVQFYNGQNWIPLQFEKSVIPPAEKIPSENPFQIQLKCFPYTDKENVPITDIAYNTAQLRIDYKLDKRKQTVFIEKIALKTAQNQYSWVAY